MTTTPARRPGRPPTGGLGSRGGDLTKQKMVRLTDEQIHWLEHRASLQGTTVSGVIRDAVAAWIAAGTPP